MINVLRIFICFALLVGPLLKKNNCSIYCASNIIFFVINIRKTPEFEKWVSELTAKEQGQLNARLFRIQEFDHFGDFKIIEGSSYPIFELRWKNGWRVYFYRE